MIRHILSRSRLTWIGACLAVMILGVMAVPWPVPSPEVLIEQFVPDLITVNPTGFLRRPGLVRVTAREIVLSTLPHSQPTVHMLTAEVPFTFSFSVSVHERAGANVFPFQVKVWNPRAEVAAEVWYAPDGSIMAGTRSSQRWWLTRHLGEYIVGDVKKWRIVRDDRRVVFEIQGGAGRTAFEIDQETFPPLFEQDVLSLTLYASALAGGSSTVAIRQPAISVPHQTRYGTTVSIPGFRTTIRLAAFLSLFWLVAWTWMLWTQTGWKRLNLRAWDLVIVLVLAGVCLLAGWWLSKTTGHPLDVHAQVLWSRIAREQGLAAITGYSLLATAGNAHGGQPYAPMSYPYPPLLTYLFWLVGNVSPVGRVEQTLKVVTMLGVVAGGGTLFVLLRQLRVATIVAAFATGAYMLNPAILFDSAVWGQTDAFVAFFLLMGTAGVVRESASLLWVGALLAFLTKQTGGLFVPVIISFGFARLGNRRMVQGLPVAIIIVFLVLSPAFLAGTHPSAIYRPVITKVLALGTVQKMEVDNAVVSQSSLTLWSAVAGLEGARGLSRMAFPDFISSRFGPSYFLLSRLVFAMFVLLLGLLFLRSRRASPGIVFLAIAAYGVGAAVLLTRILPRYFYFGVMFTAASLPWMPRRLGTITLTVLTGTMLVSMWGLLVLMSVWYPGSLPIFEPERSWLNGVVATTLSSDAGITMGGILNIGVLASLLASIYVHRIRDSTS